MTDYILVPVDLLSELAESLACELDARYPASVRSYESQDRKYQAEMEPVITARQIIADATAVQGEPVGEVRLELGTPSAVYGALYNEAAPKLVPGTKFYTAPQPEEQQPAPDVAGLVGRMRILVAAGNRLNAEAEECTYDGNTAEVAGSEYWCEFRDALEAATEALAAPQPTEQQPAPDVAGWSRS